MSVLAPFWNSAALVYRLRSSVTSRTPKAPEPLACGLRSGTRSRLKCAICSRKCTSCNRVGPLAPRVRELRSLMAGAPLLVVEPFCSVMILLRLRTRGFTTVSYTHLRAHETDSYL